VAVDASGNVYFSSLHSVWKVDRAGTLERIAGNGRNGYSGDGGAAVNAQLADPQGIAVDSGGTVYVADRDASAVRRITPGGTISTFLDATQVNGPMGLAVNAAGDLYVADTRNNRVLKCSPGGATLALGEGTLNGPEGVAVDAAGTVFVADTFNNAVRKITPDGAVFTVAGADTAGFTGETGPANGAALFLPLDVSVDATGRVYIADFGNSRIRVVADGAISTLAGNPKGVPRGEGLFALSVRLSGPTGVAVDAAGDVYFAEGSVGSGSGLAAGDFKVWRVSPDNLLYTAAGTGRNSDAGDGGAAAVAQFDTPAGMTFDRAGNLYIADSSNHRVRKVSRDGTVATVAGTGVAGFSGEGGQAAAARLDTPLGVAVDGNSNLYIADTGNQRIRKVFPNGIIGTVAGNGNASFFGDGGPATQAALHNPRAVAADENGNLYIADTLAYRVRKVDGGGIISTLAGNGTPGSGGDGGSATTAQLGLPSAVAVDAAGNVYVADEGNGTIRRIAPDGAISTVQAPLMAPRGMAADAAGNLFVADTGHRQMVRIDAGGGAAVISGTGACCYAGDGGPAVAARWQTPWGVAVDAGGAVWVADAAANAIRVLAPSAGAGPRISSVANGASNLAGPIAPGEIVVLFGSGLGPDRLATAETGADVLFGGVPGAIIYATATQVSAVVPEGVAGPVVEVAARYAGAASAPIPVALAAAAPALFTASALGSGQALAFNSDGTPNGPARPAGPRGKITLYATGIGISGAPVSATVAGSTAAAETSTGGGLAAGLVQIVLEVPEGVPAGAAEVIVHVGGAQSPAGVWVMVGPAI
jgi:uncharacterized protein (TIGR03437 family)